MNLDFNSYSLVGLNCPYFTGVEDHKQKITLDLTHDSMIDFDGAHSIHIHQDGTIYSTTLEYNSRKEEYEEDIIEDFTNNQEVRAAIDSWLKENNLYRSHVFPYEVSTVHDWAGSSLIATDLDSLLKYLKNY